MFLCSFNLCIMKPHCMILWQSTWSVTSTIMNHSYSKNETEVGRYSRPEHPCLGSSLPHQDYPNPLPLLSLSPSQINPPEVCGSRYHVTLGTQLLGALKI